MKLAPPWAFSALAMDPAGSPFPRPGLHFRAFISPILGLPIAPLLVYRLPLTATIQPGRPSHGPDIVWIDSRGNRLALPFNVSTENPVTGYFPAGARCFWARVFQTFREPAAPAATFPGFFNPLRLDAMLNTPRGPAAIVSASPEPLQVAASQIDHIVLSGSGAVTAATWLDANELKFDTKPWRFMGLPRPTGARYTSFAGAASAAEDRVKRGAPSNEALYFHPDGAMVPVTPAGELARVKALALADVQQWMDAYVDDLSAPPDDVSVAYDIPGARDGKMHVNALGALLSAAIDPGIARWLGLMDFDDAPPTATASETVLYIIRGVFRVPPPATTADAASPLRGILRSSFTSPGRDAQLAFDGLPLAFRTAFPDSVFDLWAVAAATVGVAPLAPPPPALFNVDSRNFLPATPPAAQREVAVDLSGIVAGAALAFARREGTNLTGLNPSNGTAILPIAAGAPDEAEGPGMARLFDRSAPANAFTYRVAQSDWAGRWSDWADVAVAAKARPQMPAPVPFWRALPLSAAQMASSVPEARTIEARVPSIDLDSLPPGSNIPAQVQLFVDGALRATAAVTDPTTVVQFAGPTVGRSESVTVHLTAQWLDGAGQPSRLSTDTALLLADPRQPPQVVLPTTIQYGSRPDVTGHSRITLTWTSAPVQKRFRVFYTDETAIAGAVDRVLNDPAPSTHPPSALTTAAATTLRAALSALPADIALRAAALLALGPQLPAELFTQLTGTPLERPAGGQLAFTHEVSGSLRVLSFYRVVAVSDGNVESDFTAAPMIVAAVPNTTPPAQPQLSAALDASAAPPFKLTIAVPRGSTAPVEYRVRRAIGRADDPLRMRIVDTRPLPAPLPAAAVPPGDPPPPLRFDVPAPGPLLDWQRYFWRVEVRGAREPGNGPDAAWSDASLPAVTAIIPDPAPAPVSVTAARTGPTVTVQWQHARPLRGGPMGMYRFDVYRRAEGDREQLVTTVPAFPAPAGGFAASDAAAPPNSTYRIVLIDPIGRTSMSAPASVN